MINKLAMELALEERPVSGTNNIQPWGENPSVQEQPGPFSPLVKERSEDTRQGELRRSFDQFQPSVSDLRGTIGKLLHDHVEGTSGSSAAAQTVQRHSAATK